MKQTGLGLVTGAHLKRNAEIEGPLQFACRYPNCKAVTQFGRFGIYAHTRVVHGQLAKVNADPLPLEGEQDDQPAQP